MTWQAVPVGNGLDGVTLSVTKKKVSFHLGSRVLSPRGWDEGPALNMALGLDDHAGWVRFDESDEGGTGEFGLDAAYVVSVHSSIFAVLNLANCARTPVVWRFDDEALMVKLPQRPGARAVPAKPTALRSVSTEDDGLERVATIGVPAILKELHRSAWGAGMELTFLSNGKCLLNGQEMTVDAMTAYVEGQLRAA